MDGGSNAHRLMNEGESQATFLNNGRELNGGADENNG